MELSLYPDLVKEWHPTKNGELTPKDFTHGSGKKVWWLCSKGHSYYAEIEKRTRKNRPTGCSYCSGRRVGENNNLLFHFPEIAKEWHPTENGNLTPRDVVPGSNKKAAWLCSKGHTFNTSPNNRTGQKKTGCPSCSGRVASEDNNLLFNFPEIAKEWHPTKNGDLKPKDFTHGSEKKVWWLCPKNHSYKSVIYSRTREFHGEKGTSCPFCSGVKVGEDNNLLFLFPEIAKEWHPTKNKELTPKQFTRGSEKKVWWLCPKNHSYKSVINSRTLGNSGCPKCSKQSSEPEIRILSELKWIFEEVNSRYKIDGVEIDIFLPKFNIGIEYDGSYWHKVKEERDLKKNKFLLSQKINLIRVREHPLKPLSKNDVIVTHGILDKKDLNETLKKVAFFVDNNIKEKINNYLLKSSFVNEDLFKVFRSYFPSPFPEKSLLKTHPLIADEWDYDKNHPLRPENFSHGSHNKVWWLCSKDHSYEVVIGERTSVNSGGCPFCSGRKTLNFDLFK